MRAMRASLALPLLVIRVLADDEHPSVPTDDLALLAHRLDRRSYLHVPFRLGDRRRWLLPPREAAATSRGPAHADPAVRTRTRHDSKGFGGRPRADPAVASAPCGSGGGARAPKERGGPGGAGGGGGRAGGVGGSGRARRGGRVLRPLASSIRATSDREPGRRGRAPLRRRRALVQVP